MEAYEALGISVLASFLVLLMVWASRIMWLYLLENVYLKLTCRYLTDICGTWRAEFTDLHGHKCCEETEIKQYGYRIRATTTYTITYKDGRGEAHKQFKCEGLLRNDIFSAHYWNVDRKQKGSGSFSLIVSQDGNVMKGKYAWYDVESGTVDAGDYEWKRIC
jgi:hypothetical protein